LLGRHPAESCQPAVANHVIHWGTGALLGALRGLWSALGMRGAPATATHAVVRLAFDQTVENTSGAGAPPSTWPTRERALDYVHKGLYAATTGLLADRWIHPNAEALRGRLSH